MRCRIGISDMASSTVRYRQALRTGTYEAILFWSTHLVRALPLGCVQGIWI